MSSSVTRGIKRIHQIQSSVLFNYVQTVQNLRPNGKLNCVSENTALKTGWETVDHEWYESDQFYSDPQ